MKLARLNDQAEIFHSIQGEGVSQGIPSVFVRLALCNLSCSWCDTSYSWDGRFAPVDMSVEAIASAMIQFPCRHAVITGGEPLVQQKELAKLFSLIDDFTLEMETNGTLVPDREIASRVSQFNISPKLAHSGNDAIESLRKDVLSYFAHELAQKSWFKFVVEEEGDLVCIRRLMVDCGIGQDRIILMPQAQTQSYLDAVRLRVVELCIRHGFRFSDRLHMTLWGERKGV